LAISQTTKTTPTYIGLVYWYLSVCSSVFLSGKSGPGREFCWGENRGGRVVEVEAIVSATTLVGRPDTTARALRTENLVNFRRDFEGPSPPMHGAAFSFCEDRKEEEEEERTTTESD